MSETEKTRAEEAHEVFKETEFGTSEHFLAWVESRPADEVYHYGNSRECPVIQYARAYLEGAESVSGGHVTSSGEIVDSTVSFDDCSTIRLDGRFEDWANYAGAEGVEDKDITFGRLAEYIKSRKGA